MTRRLLALLPALLVAPLAGSPATAAVPFSCQDLDYGPARSARPVIVCYARRGDGVVISTSHDRGRTWAETRASGTPEPSDHLFSVLVSPRYDTDKTIYLRYQSFGLFASTDGGATFVPVDPQGGGEMNDRMAAIDAFGPAVPGLAPEAAVALPRRGSAVFYRGAHLPVAGGGRQQDRGFYQLGHAPRGVVLNVSQGPDESLAMRFHVARCTAELACPGGYTLPKGARFKKLAVEPAPEATTAVLLMNSERLRPAIVTSRNSGRTFQRNSAFDRAVAAYAGTGNVSPHDVVVMAGGNEWLVSFHAPRGVVLLATSDGGRTWRPRAAPAGSQRMVATPDGRLLAGGFKFLCSLDRGRTWHSRCAR